MVTNSLQSKYQQTLCTLLGWLKAIPKLIGVLQWKNRCKDATGCEISANFCFQIWTRMKVGNNKEKQTSDDLILTLLNNCINKM